MSQDRKYIAYYRVSTQKQGESGLGLEAQVTMVKRFVKDESAIVSSYKEVESGKKDDRRELTRAIEQCKELGAVLLIAKLDRLSRNVTFISTLMDSGVKFICADMPDATELTIHIFAALAQHERKIISERTRMALAEKKKQGHKLGKPENLQHKHKLKGIEIIAQARRSNPNRVKASGYIKLLYKSGKSLSEIANTMNQEGFKTARGMQFSKATVLRFVK
jgi:DNA invertase Pin-like site-specific DNA recombinase